MAKPDPPKENEEDAGAVDDGVELEEGRGEKEKPELAGLVASGLDPKEKEDELDLDVLDAVVADAVAGLPKLKLGRDDGALEPAEGAAKDAEGAALEAAPLVAGLNEAAVLLRPDVLLVGAIDAFFSAASRCLRYWSRNNSMSRVRSAKGSASSCSLIFWNSIVCKEMLRPRSERSLSFPPEPAEALCPLVDGVEEGAVAVAAEGAEDMPSRMPDTMLEVLDGVAEALEVEGDAEAPSENDGVEAVVLEEVVEVLAAGAAAGLAAPKPVKPPKGFAFAGGCEAEVVPEAAVDAPKLKVGVDVEAAGAAAVAAAEEGLLNPPLLPRPAKGLEPPGALKGDDDDAAPNVTGLGAAAPGAPGVPGVPRRLGRPRMTLPAAGVAGMEPCDGGSSSDASSPSSRRICFSA